MIDHERLPRQEATRRRHERGIERVRSLEADVVRPDEEQRDPGLESGDERADGETVRSHRAVAAARGDGATRQEGSQTI